MNHVSFARPDGGGSDDGGGREHRFMAHRDLDLEWGVALQHSRHRNFEAQPAQRHVSGRKRPARPIQRLDADQEFGRKMGMKSAIVGGPAVHGQRWGARIAYRTLVRR